MMSYRGSWSMYVKPEAYFAYNMSRHGSCTNRLRLDSEPSKLLSLHPRWVGHLFLNDKHIEKLVYSSSSTLSRRIEKCKLGGSSFRL